MQEKTIDQGSFPALPACLRKYHDEKNPIQLSPIDYGMLIEACIEFQNAHYGLQTIFYGALYKAYYVGEVFGDDNQFAKLIVYFKGICDWQRIEADLKDPCSNLTFDLSKLKIGLQY